MALTITVTPDRRGRPPGPRKAAARPKGAQDGGGDTAAPPAESAPPKNLEASQQRRTYYRQRGIEPAVPKPADAPDEISEDAVAHDDDLAAVVVKKTLRGLAAGRLEPSLRDGLMAQQLLDRREEKAADRQFMFQLAQALAGGGYSAPKQLVAATPAPPEDVIEGYFEEVPLAPEHLRAD